MIAKSMHGTQDKSAQNTQFHDFPDTHTLSYTLLIGPGLISKVATSKMFFCLFAFIFQKKLKIWPKRSHGFVTENQERLISPSPLALLLLLWQNYLPAFNRTWPIVIFPSLSLSCTSGNLNKQVYFKYILFFFFSLWLCLSSTFYCHLFHFYCFLLMISVCLIITENFPEKKKIWEETK